MGRTKTTAYADDTKLQLTTEEVLKELKKKKIKLNVQKIKITEFGENRGT